MYSLFSPPIFLLPSPVHFALLLLFLHNPFYSSSAPRYQSACNHSCEPNAEVTFPLNSDFVAVRLLRDVVDGEEICISYLEECQRRRSRHSRRKQLRENYVFDCECARCEKEKDVEADETSDEEEEEEDEMEL